jgi:very-short-patch-repair endonuclease
MGISREEYTELLKRQQRPDRWANGRIVDKPKPKKRVSEFEELVFRRLIAAGIEPVREYVFAPPRRWRFDFCFPPVKIAVECEGGVWSGGRHTRGKGFEGDCEKYDQAVLQGWRVLRFTPSQIDNVVPFVKLLLGEVKG